MRIGVKMIDPRSVERARAPNDAVDLITFLEQEISELAGHLAAATCRWLLLIAEFDARGGWAEWGAKSCAHWLSYRCSIGLGAAREHVRVALRRVITYRHAGDAGVLAAYLLDPMIEDAIRDGIQKTATGSYLALEPQISRDIIAAVGRALGPEGSNGAVLLTGVEIRRYVRRLVEVEHPGLAVLSFQELAPEAQIRPIARISVG